MAEAKDIGPLDWRIAITDRNGKPTPEFQRRWNSQRGNNALIGTITFGTGVPSNDPPPADGALYADTSEEPVVLYVGFEGIWNKAGVSDFIELNDVPSTYVAQAGKIVRVKSNELGLEFVVPTANPTATASNTAVNGSATTFMRSDAAPAVQLASTSQFGLVKPDGTTITSVGGVITAAGGGGGKLFTGFANLSSFSSGAQATKGTSYRPALTMTISRVFANVNAVAGHSLRCTLATAATLPYSSTVAIASILATATVTAATPPSTAAFVFTTPVVVPAGTILLVLITDTSLASGSTSIPIASSPSGAASANGMLPMIADSTGAQHMTFLSLTSLNPSVGNLVTVGGATGNIFGTNIEYSV